MTTSDPKVQARRACGASPTPAAPSSSAPPGAIPPTLEPLIRDLVGWCLAEPRLYAEVMEAWRTSCPRLTVWEEAVARGFVETRPGSGGLVVVVTRLGRGLAGGRVASPAILPPRVAQPQR
jgi:hypothetical protein